MLQQYSELKRQHPGALLFFRLGDFYELFFDDAITAARDLEITLTARHKESANPVPMCGVPHHSASNHIARLIRKGHRVAICEQVEETAPGKKLVRREVVRVITPGTAVDPQLVEATQPAYLAALCSSGGSNPNFGIAFLDFSTGEFRATQCHGENAWLETISHIESFAPRELLFPASLAPLLNNSFSTNSILDFHRQESTDSTAHITRVETTENDLDSHGVAARINPSRFQNQTRDTAFARTPLDDWLWLFKDAESLLCSHFRVQNLDGFRLADRHEAVRAAAACLRYAQETQRLDTRHIADLKTFETHDHLVLDHVTLRNLEIVESQSERGTTRTLLGVLDTTVTNMGARMLRSWVLRPLIQLDEINARLSAVEEFFISHINRDNLRSQLKQVVDLERLTARLSMNTASPRDISTLRRSLESLPKLKPILSDSRNSLIRLLAEDLDELTDVLEETTRTLAEEPPINIADGGVIRTGLNAELDDLRAISSDAKATIAALENRERTRSGISTLRIRYNNVFGYYIEVGRAQAARVPPDYERRQTLANAERFTTPELKQYETRLLGADERIAELETSLFAELRASLATRTNRLQTTARVLATLDVLAALAETAARRRYVKPELSDGDELSIKAGRHPVIESFSQRPFVANDLSMNNSGERVLIITGPNMGGKSTILRQTALIAVMAQFGSFVPATAARLPIFDRIWTRVGASDDLASGRSTFMVEMTETAAILRGATTRSLVLLDEIGRGTATFDGLSLAWAVVEHLHDSPEHAAKTLFATHYHELTELAVRLTGAKNYRIRVSESDDQITFLYQLERGAASKSYGIEVARLAGVPSEVLKRAREVLLKLEEIEFDIFADKSTPIETGNSAIAQETPNKSPHEVFSKLKRSKLAAQITLFQATNDSLLQQLRDTKIEDLSAEEMQTLLKHLQTRSL